MNEHMSLWHPTKEGGDHMKKGDPQSVIPPLLQSNTFPIVTDPFGSYTGLVNNLKEKPVQDADDL